MTISQFPIQYYLSLILILAMFCSEENQPLYHVLKVSLSSIEFSPEKETATVEIVSNGSWSVDPVDDWIEVTPKSGQGNGMVTLTTCQNHSGNDRQQTAIVRLRAISQQVQLHQKMLGNEFYIAPDQSGMRNISSLELVKEYGLGWNLGNSLEAIGGRTAWANPAASEEIMESKVL